MPLPQVLVAAFPGCQSLDVVGPAEVFASAGGYEVRIAAPAKEPFAMSNGIVIQPHTAMRPLRADIDTLVIAGGKGTRAAATDERVIRWVQQAAARSRRVTSVCTGAFLLAQAGLLDGRRATTHWEWCAELARLFPQIAVDPDAIFVRDENVYTSAGVTAGMDLALALVEDDKGPEVARRVAQQLVVFLRRPGGQSQFSAQLAAPAAARDGLRELQAWIPANVAADLTVPILAERAHMSPRNFARAFRREIGMTPAAYVEAARVEQARIALEGSAAPVEEVAQRCGFGTVETMRRAFHRRLGVGPSAYRNRFQPLIEEVA